MVYTKLSCGWDLSVNRKRMCVSAVSYKQPKGDLAQCCEWLWLSQCHVGGFTLEVFGSKKLHWRLRLDSETLVPLLLCPLHCKQTCFSLSTRDGGCGQAGVVVVVVVTEWQSGLFQGSSISVHPTWQRCWWFKSSALALYFILLIKWT